MFIPNAHQVFTELLTHSRNGGLKSLREGKTPTAYGHPSPAAVGILYHLSSSSSKKSKDWSHTTQGALAYGDIPLQYSRRERSCVGHDNMVSIECQTEKI